MQLLCSKSDIYVKGIESVLKCSRSGAVLELAELESMNVIGDVCEYIGKLVTDVGAYLLFVTHASKVGELGRPGAEVFCIEKVVALPIVDDQSLSLSWLDVDSNGLERLRNNQKKLLEFVTNRAQASDRVVDEVLKLINDSASFYYSRSVDLTLSSQKAVKDPQGCVTDFFWNKNLLAGLLDEKGHSLGAAHEWTIRVIHGYFEQRFLSYDNESQLRLTLVSRRSVKRAGCRYLKRGVDQDGNVANFVETEMMVDIFGHTLSFVQMRGSIPIYWSQKGYRYRPPLNIDKPLSESISAFRKHIDVVKANYGAPLSIVNLVDQTGREFALGEAFLQHVLELDDTDIRYFMFDFHEHCRALKFDKVSRDENTKNRIKVNILLNALEPSLAQIGFCWIDKSGQLVRQQTGIIRTNCVDCLDRTNVVQSAISQNVCANQVLKLGLVDPFSETPQILVQALQTMWADHGDFISRQYAGTNALKGDITRGGQRKFTGLVKDGYNSASRYYLSHVKDSQRQRAMDAIISGDGRISTFQTSDNTETAVAEENTDNDKDTESDDEEEEPENVGRMVHETARFILSENEVLVGGWALVEGSSQTNQVDTVLLLTRTQILIALYADDSEKLLDLKKINFEDLARFDIGPLDKNKRIHLRIHWKNLVDKKGPGYGTWRAAKTRLFNNVAIALKDSNEADEYIQAIADQIKIMLDMCGFVVPLQKYQKLGGQTSSESRTRSAISSLGAKLFSPLIKKGAKEGKGTSLDVQPAMVQSKSDGLLANVLSSGLSKLQDKIKAPLARSTQQIAESADADPADVVLAQEISGIVSRRDPFESYRESVLKSNSTIVML